MSQYNSQNPLKSLVRELRRRKEEKFDVFKLVEVTEKARDALKVPFGPKEFRDFLEHYSKIIDNYKKNKRLFNKKEYKDRIISLLKNSGSFKRIEDFFIQKADNFIPWVFCSVMRFFARLEYPIGQEVFDKWIDSSKCKMEAFDAWHLSNSVWWLAKVLELGDKEASKTWLGTEAWRDWRDTWIKTSQTQIAEEAFNVQELSDSVWGLAKICRFNATSLPDTAWYDAWLQSYTKIMDKGCAEVSKKDQQLTINNIWSLAKLAEYAQNSKNYKDQTPLRSTHMKEWLNKWLTSAYNIMSSFTKQNLPISLWGLAKLKKLGELSDENMKIQGKNMELSQKWLDNLKLSQKWLDKWIKVSDDQIQNFIPQGVAMSIWGLAVFEYNPKEEEPSKKWEEWIQKWNAHSCSLMRNKRPTPQDLSMTIWAVAKLRSSNPALGNTDWQTKWMRLSQQEISNLSPQGLSTCLEALAKLATFSTNWIPNQEWRQQWMERVALNLQEGNFSSQSLSMIVLGLATILKKLKEGQVNHTMEEWIQNNLITLWIKQSQNQMQMKHFAVKGFSDSIWGLTKIADLSRYKNIKWFPNVSEWVETWLTHSEEKLDQFNPQQLAKNIWALGKLSKTTTLKENYQQNLQEEWILTLDIWNNILKSWIDQALKKFQSMMENQNPLLNPQSLSMSIWGLGKIYAQIKAKKIKGDSQDINREARDLYRNRSTLKFWLDTWMAHSHEKLQEFSHSGLYMSIQSLSDLAFYPKKEWINAWFKASENKFETFIEQEDDSFVNILHALTGFSTLSTLDRDRYPNLQAWVTNWYSSFVKTYQAKKKFNQSLEFEVSRILWSLIVLDPTTAKTFYENANSIIKPDQKQQNPILNIKDKYQNLEKEYEEQGKKLNPRESEIKNRVTFSTSYLSLICGAEGIDITDETQSKKDEEMQGLRQIELRREFEDYKPYEKERYTEAIDSSVDIYFPNERVILEIDGPFHYVILPNGSLELRIKDVRRDQILRNLKVEDEFDYEIFRFPSLTRWRENEQRKERKARKKEEKEWKEKKGEVKDCLEGRQPQKDSPSK